MYMNMYICVYRDNNMHVEQADHFEGRQVICMYMYGYVCIYTVYIFI
jgi:hypothetical protein